MAEIRNQQAKIIRQDYADFYRISGGLTLVVLGIWIGSLLFNDGYGTNVYTEALGVLATILVLDQFNRWRETQALKKRLLMEVRSPAHDTAVTALEWLRREGWLDPDTFKGETLERISWNGAYLGGLSFENARLREARLLGVTSYSAIHGDKKIDPINFQHTHIRHCKLENSTFTRSNFSHSDIFNCTFVGCILSLSHINKTSVFKSNFSNIMAMGGNFSHSEFHQCQFDAMTGITINFSHCRLLATSFKHAELVSSDLSYSDCSGSLFSTTNLSGSNLTASILRGCDLESTKLDNVVYSENSVLPDGTRWTPDTDLAKFTDRNHPNFASTREAINTIRAEMDLPPLD
ncbi:MAG: pentapeptide repeat-containing protein [Chloroflexota bacterium]